MIRRAALLFALLLLPASTVLGQYARPQLLIEPTELARPEVVNDYVILDVRSDDAFAHAHVPGAIRVDHDEWKSAFGDGEDVAAWSGRIGALGIGSDTDVVVYDDVMLKDAARIWWILRYWGVEHAQLLNGGWRTWTAEELPVARDTVKPAPAAFTAVPHVRRLLGKQRLLSLLGGGRLQVVDSRSEGEYCGTTPLKNRRAGAIPGAVHLEWSDLVDADSHRVKSAAQLQGMFDAAEIDLAGPVTTHCQSGGRAAVMVFALELMGADNVSNYYRGWSEWGNADDTPIQPGTKQ
ncbi:MAG: rhodanese-like domain-containing protein [Pirellulales bacterium]